MWLARRPAWPEASDDDEELEVMDPGDLIYLGQDGRC